MKSLILLIFCLTAIMIYPQTNFPEINSEIAAGNFTSASRIINQKLFERNLSSTETADLEFQVEKMERIRKDFTKSKEKILSELKEYYPGLNEKQLEAWEKERSIEVMLIDGEKRYFKNASANLFRINKDAKTVKEAKDGPPVRELDSFLLNHIPQSINKIGTTEINGNPVIISVDYTLTVKKDVVPEGEIIRCWLPYPRDDSRRQTDIKLISVNDKNYIISDNSFQHKTLYLEKPSVKGEPTVFNVKFEYASHSEFHNIDPFKIKPYDESSDLYIEYTSERAPHIVFTPEIKKLSDKIVAGEKNPYLAAKKIFTWINDNIPWASALEYSTIDSISSYCYKNMHGDCGIKTLLFMTLARLNGIPAKWQSGWMLHPPEVNLHDWGEIYFEGYGWVPVDQSFGIQESDDESVRNFYLGGIDSYRLIVNDDYSRDLFPAKIYPRSETVDFQRGEVEWRGGNLYFDQWNYSMKTDYKEGNE